MNVDFLDIAVTMVTSTEYGLGSCCSFIQTVFETPISKCGCQSQELMV